MNLAQIIRTARKSKKLTQAEVGKALRVSGSAVSQWESGETKPDPGQIGPLAQFLDIDPVKLSVERTGAANPLKKMQPMGRKIDDPATDPEVDLDAPRSITRATAAGLQDGSIQLLLFDGRTLVVELRLSRDQAHSLCETIHSVL